MSAEEGDEVEHVEEVKEIDLDIQIINIRPSSLSTKDFREYAVRSNPRWQFIDQDLLAQKELEDRRYREKLTETIINQYT